jgi:polyhydroxyalkanoate synthesis regulator phasin
MKGEMYLKKQTMLLLVSILCVTALAAGAAFAVNRTASEPDVDIPGGGQGVEVIPVSAGTAEPKPSETPESKSREFRFSLPRTWDGTIGEEWLDQVKKSIEQAVNEGKMTRQTADTILEIIENRSVLIPSIEDVELPDLSRFSDRVQIFGGEEFSIEGFVDGFLNEDAVAGFFFHPEPSMFSGDYFEENKDKTLGQLKDEWLAELKAKLDEAVASGKMTQEQADQTYRNAEEGKGALLFPGERGGFFQDIPQFRREFRSAPESGFERAPDPDIAKQNAVKY